MIKVVKKIINVHKKWHRKGQTYKKVRTLVSLVKKIQTKEANLNDWTHFSII